jgi:ferredoxin
MKVRIKNELCVGHGMCRLACPQIFQLNDQDGHAYVLKQEVPVELEDAVEFAIGSCPEKAIEVFK